MCLGFVFFEYHKCRIPLRWASVLRGGMWRPWWVFDSTLALTPPWRFGLPVLSLSLLIYKYTQKRPFLIDELILVHDSSLCWTVWSSSLAPKCTTATFVHSRKRSFTTRAHKLWNACVHLTWSSSLCLLGNSLLENISATVVFADRNLTSVHVTIVKWT